MIILYAIPVFMVLIAFEAIFDRLKGTKYYRLNDAVSALSTGMLNRTMDFLILYLSWATYSKLFERFAWFELEQSILVWVAGFVLYDFLYYWSHRIAHIYSLFWNAHAVHHHSEEFNLTTALRQPFSDFVKGSIVFIPMVFLGFDPLLVATVGSLNLVYQFWVHTRFVPKLGWIETIFVTPSNHRVHHGMNDAYIDKNFGGVFIVWDRLFKTFQEELESDPVVFGVRKQLNSFNPFFANFQIYIQMAKDIWVGRSVRLAIQVLMSRTGHRPEIIAERAPIPRLNLNTYQRFNPLRVAGSLALVWTQLLFSLAYTLWFLLSVEVGEFYQSVVYFVPLALTLLSMNSLLEGRLLGWWLEAIRLMYILIIVIFSAQLWSNTFMLAYCLCGLVVFMASYRYYVKMETSVV
jgi:sterol desaturase/sphingolipid hydroxylase (fatty acid hydroxylase superfamily)